MFSQQYRQLFRIVWLQVLLFSLVLSIGRQIFLWNVGDYATISGIWADFWQSTIIGFRFDLRVGAMAFAPILLIGLLLANTRFYRKLIRALPIYNFVIYFLAAAVTIGNYYYFKTYNNHYDIFVFGLVEDDTKAVLDIMWNDYPILSSVFASLLVAFVTSKLMSFATLKIKTLQWPTRTWYINTLSITVMILVYFIAARGSIGTFPLKQYHANVSDYEVLNKVTPNGFLALSWANSQHKKDSKFTPIATDEYKAKLKQVIGRDNPIYRTAANPYLAENKPNVVFALMESMGTNLFSQDDPENNDLMGALRPYYNKDFTFKRFLSGGTGTMHSITMMLFNSNNTKIADGSSQKVNLSGSAFRPYKKSGYKVVYITGGSPTWRNIRYYMPRQGVDEFYDENDIEKVFPEAKESSNTWGVLDGYAFKFAEKILAENDKPVMMMIQTQTNHPPYEKPKGYTAKPLTATPFIKKKLALDEEQTMNVLTAYQYAVNALGEFVGTVTSDSKERATIIAASGDHHLRSFAVDYPKDIAISNSVPFYLHIPKSILRHTQYRYDEMRIGSHRDIFPTLYNFSLSNTEYYSLGGRNLLAPKDIQHPFAYNADMILTKQGAVNSSRPQVLYPWKDDSTLDVKTTPIDNPHPNIAKDYNHLQGIFIRSQVAGFSPL